MFFGRDFFVFVAAQSVAAISPGPGLAAIVATVFAGGAHRAIWFCVDVIVGDLVWLTLSLSGLALIAQQIPISLYALAAEKARNVRIGSQSVRKFNRITATALGGAVAWIAAK